MTSAGRSMVLFQRRVGVRRGLRAQALLAAMLTTGLAAGHSTPSVEAIPPCPDTASLAGRLVEGAAPTERVWFLALQPAEASQDVVGTPPLVTSSGAGGSFCFESIAAGAYDLFALQRPAGWVTWEPGRLNVPASGSAGPATFEGQWAQVVACAYLGRVQTPSSVADLAFDVAAYRPGRVRVQVLRDGLPVPRAMLRLRTAGTASTVSDLWAASDPKGWSELSGVFPCEYDASVEVPPVPLSTTVRPPQTLSGDADARRVVVSAGEDVEWTLTLPLCSATLLVLDKDGDRPLPATPVRVWHRESETWIVDYVLTDADGRVALTRPPGELRVARLPASTAVLLQPREVSGAAEMGPFYELWSRMRADVSAEAWRRDAAVPWDMSGAEVRVRLAGPSP